MNKIFLLFLTMVFSLTVAVFALADENESPPPLDIVLVLDIGDSMRFSDPLRAVLSSAAQFVDMVGAGQSRMGVIGFSGEVERVIPMHQLADSSALAGLRENILDFQYAGEGNDIGLALLAAANMLSGVGELQDPMIILITDQPVTVSREDRLAEDSYADIVTALRMLEQMRVHTYTIGLTNIHNQADRELMHQIALRTNANSRTAATVHMLPGMFFTILDIHRANVFVPETEPEITPTPSPTPTPQPEIEPDVDDYEEEDAYEIDEYDEPDEPEPTDYEPEDPPDPDPPTEEVTFDDLVESGTDYETPETDEYDEENGENEEYTFLIVLAMAFGLAALVSTVRLLRVVM
jgi:hypothetical protein